jgi:hypothetical protein
MKEVRFCRKVEVAQRASTGWGSGSHSQVGGEAAIGFEDLSERRIDLAVEDGTANLEQKVGTSAGLSHLLRLVHAAVDQEVGGCFGEWCADPQTGTIALSVVDQPSALAGEIAIDFSQRSPQLAWRRISSTTVLTLENWHDLDDAVQGDLVVPGVAVPDAPMQAVCGLASKLKTWPYYTYRIDSSSKSASRGDLLSALMEGHPESSISSENQQLEPSQLVTQAWTPIHSWQEGHSEMDALVSGTAIALVQGCRCFQVERDRMGKVPPRWSPWLIMVRRSPSLYSSPRCGFLRWWSDCRLGFFQTQKITWLANFLSAKQPDRSCSDCPQKGEGSAKVW